MVYRTADSAAMAGPSVATDGIRPGVDPCRGGAAAGRRGAVDMPNYLARMRLADLFLDTHPDCAEAMKVFACACEKLEAAKAAYNEAAPLTPCAAAGSRNWSWGCTPWPWEG